ncbi:hypothetical protein GMRT_12166 [Giardia muris]|uniref:GB1/RHD3-type G domain-containing protein n=1 Tax=Giardia muris TaxID=5742 RepID=A0A4Z1SR36_GIAMU|nr:hypothetical protein GMRT_12211 [Giardia muris]TNJ28358.1 hypothetical protein GMRT_12166 [Giardia muris]|eukprot:TNJ28354.1 hypothetical protein GMRT_12211 [Giardia muris]
MVSDTETAPPTPPGEDHPPQDVAPGPQGAEAPLITGEGAYSEEYTALCTGYPESDSIRHACIAIFGPQSSGKSTLLNDLFGTSFRMLDGNNGQRQMTRGITAGIIPSIESSPALLLFDCEGSESGERHREGNQNIEHYIGSFAAVTADILIINILMTDVGRSVGSCSNLLESIFKVYFRLRNGQNGAYHKLKIFIVVRRYNGEGEESMRDDLSNSVREIYKSSVLSEFSEFCERFDDFIDLKFWFIREKFREDSDGNRRESRLYKKQLREIRTQLSELAAEAIRQPVSSGRLPLTLAETPETYKSIWERICNDEDLDFPSIQEALSTKRCIEKAQGCTEQLDADLKGITLNVPNTLHEILEMRIDGIDIAQRLIDAGSNAALSFDEQTEGYLEGPRIEQRRILYQHISPCLRDKANSIVDSVVGTAMRLVDEASQDAKSRVPNSVTNGTLMTLKNLLEEADEMQATHRDGLRLEVPELLHSPAFPFDQFIERRVAQWQNDARGTLGLFNSICRGLLVWSVKVVAPFGVLCDIEEHVSRVERRVNDQMDAVAEHFEKILKEQFSEFSQQQLRDSKIDISYAIRVGADVARELNGIYSTLVSRGHERLESLCNALDISRRDIASSLLQQYSTIVGEDIRASILQKFRSNADGSIFVHLWRCMEDKIKFANFPTRGQIDAEYNRVKEGLETYVRSFGIIVLNDHVSQRQVTIDLHNDIRTEIVLEKMNHIWILGYNLMVLRFELMKRNTSEIIKRLNASSDKKREDATNNKLKIKDLDVEIAQLRDEAWSDTRRARKEEKEATKKRIWAWVTAPLVIPAIHFASTASDCADRAAAARDCVQQANEKIVKLHEGQKGLYSANDALNKESDELRNSAGDLESIETELKNLFEDVLTKADELARDAMDMGVEKLALESDAERQQLRKKLKEFIARFEAAKDQAAPPPPPPV